MAFEFKRPKMAASKEMNQGAFELKLKAVLADWPLCDQSLDDCKVQLSVDGELYQIR